MNLVASGRNGVVEEREKFRAAVGTGRRNTADGRGIIFLAHGPEQDVKPLLEVVVAVDSCGNLLEVDGASFASLEGFLDLFFIACLLLLLDGGLGLFIQVHRVCLR